MGQAYNYRIHNPNTDAALAAHLFKLFIEVNEDKVDHVLGELFQDKVPPEATDHITENNVQECNA